MGIVLSEEDQLELREAPKASRENNIQTSREIMTKAELLPKLRLGIKTGNGVKPTGSHKVKIISDNLIRKMNMDGQEEHFVRYMFEEDGQQKQYDAHMK